MSLDSLNPQQREAATSLHGPLLVLAGAGTGKTTVITRRIACLLEAGIKPEHILAVTFTNKASREMKERVEKLLPQVPRNTLTVSTFHSFCCRVLRQHIKHLGYDRNFGIADDSDQEGILKQAIGDLALQKNEQNTAQAFRVGISNAKNQMQGPDEVTGLNKWFEVLAEVYRRYQRQLKDMNLVDFDDLLLLTVRLWQEQADVLRELQDKYRYILVDEFQDTNQVQAELIRLLAGKNRNVCVVGDDDQSIYGWRGADVSNILDFPQNYPGTKVVKLEQNYRSTNVILRVANELIAKNTKRHLKELWSEKPEGDLIRFIESETETEEADFVAKLCKEMNIDHRLDFSDIAVLYRSKYQSRVLEVELRKQGVPYRIVGSRSFYEQREIKDAVAYLRIVHNEREDLSLLRILNVPPRGIGSVSIDKLKAKKEEAKTSMLGALRKIERSGEFGAAATASVRDFLFAYDRARKAFREPGQLGQKMEAYFRGMGYLTGLKKIYKNHEDAIQRQENIEELIHAAAEFEIQHGESLIGLQEFLEEYALTDDNDRVDDKSDEGYGVTLMTVHAAKGLEFPVVIVAGMEDKLFPHERSIEDRDLDEERRLFYVAVTRAKEKLYMTRAKKRSRYNGVLMQRPSRFIRELPEELVETVDAKEALRPATAEEMDELFSDFYDRFPDDKDD